ncbi:MAG: hypothetical protein ACKPKO_33850, partial [Candidatus Fonsibacter sp.]
LAQSGFSRSNIVVVDHMLHIASPLLVACSELAVLFAVAGERDRSGPTERDAEGDLPLLLVE